MLQDLIEYLNWDTNFFGFKIGKYENAQSALDENKIIELYENGKDNNYNLIYLFDKSLTSFQDEIINGINCNYVDCKYVYSADIPEVLPVSSKKCRLVNNIDLYEELLFLAFESGGCSRFKTDINFKNNEFEKLYLEWLNNSLNHQIADAVYIYEDNAHIKGLVTVKYKCGKAVIGLIAVHPNFRGNGIGEKLMQFVFINAKNYGCKSVEVATQKVNIGARRFYERLNMNLEEVINIYHLWL